MPTKKTVVFSFLGTSKDVGFDDRRWEKWRPSIALCQQKDFVVDRLELLSEAKFTVLAKQVVADIAQVSPETQVVSRMVNMRDPWNFREIYELLYTLCRDYPFDLEKEDYYAHMTTGTHVAQICLFLVVEARFLPGRLVQTGPARRREELKDPTHGSLTMIDLDLSNFDLLRTRFAKEQAEAQDFLRSGIATKNPAFNALIQELEIVALRSKAPILLTGPTGAGKSQLARRIYELRQSRNTLTGDFVEINCATLRGDTAMSTLFGHKKGAYTGAAADRPGVLRQAHQGLLFLDEIGELGRDEQAMLLRALEEGTFLPVGSDTPVKSRFQLIAGTNRDLRMEVTHGTFREDLFARINLWTFTLPSLRERREDIAPNITFELQSFAEKEGRGLSFNKEALERFLHFAAAPTAAWLGNFRDLNAAITRMGTLAPQGRIRITEVEQEITRLHTSWQRAPEPDPLAGLVTEELDSFDRVQLIHVVKTCREAKSLSAAGRALFSTTRQKKANPNDSDRLRKYLAKFGLSFESL